MMGTWADKGALDARATSADARSLLLVEERLPVPHLHRSLRPGSLVSVTTMLGLLWYAYTILAAFVFLLGNIYPRLTLVEIALASVPVGTIGGAWLAFSFTALFSTIK